MIKLYGWRGCGKSTNLSQRAYSLAKKGKKVLIVVPIKGTEENIRYYLETANDKEALKRITIILASQVVYDRGFHPEHFDAILVDEGALCLNSIFCGKIDTITDSINEHYLMEGII